MSARDILSDLIDLLPVWIPPLPPIPYGVLRKLIEGHGSHSPVILEYDKEIEAMTEAKKREWMTRYPDRPGLVRMALSLAENYADRYSDWIVRTMRDPELRAKAYREFYRIGLETVAEEWIKKMAI
ncbi:MAG: hypothetical protein QXW83_00115 [Nitrososphaerales archaeon]